MIKKQEKRVLLLYLPLLCADNVWKITLSARNAW